MIHILQWTSNISAAISAILWFLSAIVKIPDRLTFPVTKPHMSPTLHALGGTYIGQASCPELQENAERLRKQAKLNTWAAVFTSIAIGIQALYSVLS